MKDLVFLEYAFVFDSTSTWQHQSYFEADLADFLAAHGMSSEIVKAAGGGQGKRLVFIKRIDKMLAPVLQTNRKDINVQKRIKQAGKEFGK